MIALIQIELGNDERTEIPYNELSPLYDQQAEATRLLLADKNHDYGEAWREMRISSITDIILMKLMRIKQIEDNEGITLISEGVTSNYQDIINYSVLEIIFSYEVN